MKNISKITNFEFSETGDFVDITCRLSYLNDYNYNGFKLKTNEDKEKTEISVQSLVNTPVVAYYNSKDDDFTGHMVIKTKDGIKFGTQAVGTHTSAWIQNDKVKPVFSEEEFELPCIYGKARIWASRFPEFYNVLKTRLEKDEMYTSWELNPTTLEKDEVSDSRVPNPRSSDEWVFLGNCLLGSSNPAYGQTSKVLEFSTDDNMDVELAEALSKDIENINKNNKSSDIKDVIKSTVEETIKQLDSVEKSTEDINNKYNNKEVNNMTEKKIESSSLTMNDLHQKIHDQLNPRGWSSNPYYSGVMIYPEEHKVVCYDIDRESEQDFCESTYSVESDDSVNLSALKPMKFSLMPMMKDMQDNMMTSNSNVNIEVKLDETARLLASKEVVISEKEVEISNLNTKITDLNNELSQKVETINKLGDEVDQLKQQVSELTPFKEEHDRVVAEKEAQELAEKKEKLKEYATKGGYITNEEIETSEEIKTMIENFDETGIKLLRAERIEKKLEEEKIETSEQSQTKVSTEKTETAQVNLDNGDDSDISPLQAIKLFLKK